MSEPRYGYCYHCTNLKNRTWQYKSGKLSAFGFWGSRKWYYKMPKSMDWYQEKIYYGPKQVKIIKAAEPPHLYGAFSYLIGIILTPFVIGFFLIAFFMGHNFVEKRKTAMVDQCGNCGGLKVIAVDDGANPAFEDMHPNVRMVD